MDISLAPAVVGVLSAIVAELLKLFPALRSSPLASSATALVVMIVGTYLSLGYGWDWTTFGQVVLYSFASYKILVQPVATSAGSRTQA